MTPGQRKALYLRRYRSKIPHYYLFKVYCHIKIQLQPDPAFHFDADPDPTFHFDADPDPDPASQNDADPDPQHNYNYY